MKKTIPVIVTKTTKNLGTEGSIIQVSIGYASNYLIPKSIVEIATPGKIKHRQMFNKIKQKQEEEFVLKAYAIQKNLDKLYKITIKKKVGDNKQIFGSVTEKEIIEQIQEYTGEQINKKQIILPEVKQIGIYNIVIKITKDINTTLKLQILPENI